MSRDIQDIIIGRIMASLPEDAVKKGVLATCSGGADSTALLRALRAAGIPVVVAHCNFNLRGDESLRDADFVEQLCRQLDVPLLTTSFDVSARCLTTGESVEMACRSLRYEWFRQIVADQQLGRIAVAHNSDDNVETMLLNLFRGTGLAGLTAMSRDNGEVWRPLLTTSRDEILKYLDAIGQSFVTDSSNLTSDYRRNFIRREVIPLIESRWPSVRKAILTTRDNLESVENVYSAAISSLMPDEDFLSFESISLCADERAIIFEFLRPASPSDEVLRSVIKHVRMRLQGEPHKLRSWKGEKSITLERDGIRLSPLEGEVEMPELEWTELSPTSENIEMAISNQDSNVAYFPNSQEHYELRLVQPGDRIALFGGGSVKISKAMKDAKYSSKKKRNQTILVRKSDNVAVWAPGLRRGAVDLISPDSTEVFWKCRKK